MAFAGGTGTSVAPYLISTAAQFNDIRSYMSAYFKQINDIDLSSYTNWTPIGTTSSPFKGNIDGGNFKLTGLKISRSTTSYVGLFGYTSGCVVKNVWCYSSGTIVGKNNVGLFVGGTANSSAFTHCFSIGDVLGTLDDVGEFVGGSASSSIFTDCHASGNVTETVTTSYYNVGGFAGGANSSKFIGCSAKGNIIGANDDVGGFVGYSFNSSTYLNCYAICNISGTKYGFGGFAGDIAGGSFTNCYCAGTINATGTLAGFAAHSSGATFTNSYFDTETTGKTDSYVTAKTTLEMKTQSTFINWDFINVWGMDSGVNVGYPYLLSQIEPEGGLDIYVITDTGLKQVSKAYIIADTGLLEVIGGNSISDTGLI